MAKLTVTKKQVSEIETQVLKTGSEVSVNIKGVRINSGLNLSTGDVETSIFGGEEVEETTSESPAE